jgi:hypothetical protein
MPLDRSQFVAGDRLFNGQAILQAPHPEPSPIKIHLVTTQVDRFTDPKAVAIHHQHQQMITDAVPTIFGGVEERRDFRAGQEIFGPLVGIGSHRVTTFYISPVDRPP